MDKLYPRWQKKIIEQSILTRRILILGGPRQCGKTTLARTMQSTDTEYLTLDDLTLREAAENDPHGFVKIRGKTLIIDEVQRVPVLFPAIKKVVDEDTRMGQYLLTGSANIQSLPSIQESLAGRVKKIRLRPLSRGELQFNQPGFLTTAFSGEFETGHVHYDREEILEMAIRGGFPEALALPLKESKSWHLDYIQALLDRDLRDIARIQRIEAMRDLVNVVAAWSSKYMDVSSIGSGLSIRRPTLETYLNALEALYLVERVKPWTKTDYERVGRQVKLFMTDCGLMSSILGWQMDKVRLDPDRSGKLVETFIFNELASLVDAYPSEYQLYHYRDREKREIDFIIERDDGALLGIEIKSGSSITKKQFKHLTWFQDRLAENSPFTGIVLYSGEKVVSFGPNLWGVPFGALWA